jgi:O-antigen/teichoic acid export membrane protein
MVPAAVSSYIASPAAWGASAFLARQPGGYEELALYSAANNIRLLALFIPNIVNTVSMSLLNNVKGQRREYRWTYAINVSAMVLLSLAVALPVVLCGRSALGMFGSVFTDGYPVLVILMISTLPESLGIALFQHIQAENRMWLSLVTITVPQSIILAGLASVLVTGYGARGLAMAYGVSWLIAAVTIMLLVKVIGRRPAVAVPVPD